MNSASLIDLIGPSLAILWKEWSANMELASYDDATFCLRGECPHCHTLAAFPSVKTFQEYSGKPELFPTDYRVKNDQSPLRIIGINRCQACNEYLLGILRVIEVKESDLPHYRKELKLAFEKHLPLGTPNDSVASEIPANIAADFQEALKCRWIKSFKATVLMCRRALQVSCDQEKAEGKDLFLQIDDLAKKQRITEPLKKMAHRIRLLGKKGAHGDYSDIDETITEKDADDAIKFMRHYLEHVYILPISLDGP